MTHQIADFFATITTNSSSPRRRNEEKTQTHNGNKSKRVNFAGFIFQSYVDVWIVELDLYSQIVN